MSRGAAILTLVALGVPAPAQAFCGFFVAGGDAKLINNASQVVLMRKGNRTVMTMSNNYQGPAEDFAMVVPVPVVLQKEDVKTLPMDVFDRVDSLSAPRLVEYWERDPCERRRMYEGMPAPAPSAAGGMRMSKAKTDDLGVTIEARFTAGEYEVLILSAKESTGLETWLRLNKYRIPDGAAGALAPYVRDKSKFFVAKVDSKKVKRNPQGVVQLSPLRFAFDSNELRLPVRLGLLNAGGKQDLIVYVIHPESRFEVANYTNTFIPTNLEVADEVRQSFGSFYAELFDATIDRLGGKAVVTEYSWQTTGCDPCPVPPLTAGDLATLGLDVIEPGNVLAAPQKPGAAAPMRRPFFGGGASWVLTRLHTRYSKETLSEDLVFRQAPPVLGGRSNWDGASSDAGAQVMSQGGVNNFQGRYIIRHYWTGPVSCKNPAYGQWGGPPGNAEGRPTPTAAKGLALAPRGKVVLRKAVRSPVPTLGIPASPPPRRQPSRP
jgi:hypothetical protein